MPKQTEPVFHVQKISPHIYQIQDPMQVYMYLVVGREKCCLLDSGWGFRGLRRTVQEITSLPVTLILTHGHADHAGGVSEFDTVYLHPVDLPLYRFYQNTAYRDLIAGFDMGARFELQPYDMRTPLPLHDGMLFDLGGVTVEMLHVPGHTAGFMMALIREDRRILFGDGCGPGTLLIEDSSLNLSDYRKALERILPYEPEYDVILRNHGQGVSEKSLLQDVIRLCDVILRGEDDHCPAKGHMYEELEKNFGHRYYTARAVLTPGCIGNITYRDDKAR